MYRLFAFFISLYFSFGGTVLAPSTEAPVKPADGKEVNLCFAAVADPQVSNYMFKRVPVFDAACEDLHNNASALDALLIAGDIAENGLDVEYKYVYDGISGLGCRYLPATGNHDIRLRSYKQTVKRFADWANSLNGDSSIDSLTYSYTVKGYKFIIMGSDSTEFEEADFSNEQLAWLESEIAGCSGKPCFVVFHQPLKLTHGLPDTWGSPIDSAGSVGKQSDELKKIMTAYKNVILITGHLHTGFGKYTYETVDGLNMVNLPSLCINNKDGEYNDAGIGYIVECSDSVILFRARDFAKGIWVSDYDISIEVK